MVDVPAIRPVTIPEVALTTELLLLGVQVPPDGELKRVVVPPSQTVGVPVIAAGLAFTVIIADLLQPVLSV